MRRGMVLLLTKGVNSSWEAAGAVELCGWDTIV